MRALHTDQPVPRERPLTPSQTRQELLVPDWLPIPFILTGMVMMAIAGTQSPAVGRPRTGAAGLISFGVGIVLFLVG